MTLGVNRNVRMPRPKGARPPFGPLRDATIHPAHATLRLPTHTLSSPQGAEMAQMGRFLYCPINLAIALRHVAWSRQPVKNITSSTDSWGLSMEWLVNNPLATARFDHGIIVSQRGQSHGR